MGNKRIRVSSDGSTFYTLPGNQGERRTELAQVNDTIFGQDYESNNPNLAQANVTANGLFKGVAGYNVVLKRVGDTTAMTDEATTQIGSTKSYQITNAAKRVLDIDVAVTVEDGSTPVSASNIESIDYMSGIVTFISSFTPSGAVTVSGSYLPLGSFGCSRSFTLTQTAAENDTTCYEFAQANEGFRRFERGLKTVSLEVGGIFQAATDWLEILKTRQPMIIEADLDASDLGKTIWRGMFRPNMESQSGNQGATEESSQQFSLYVPDGDLVEQPFGWYFNNSSLNMAIRKVLDSWQNNSTLYVQYLPDGTTGWEGEAIVTEASLANTIEGQNEFSFGFRWIGAPTAVV